MNTKIQTSLGLCLMMDYDLNDIAWLGLHVFLEGINWCIRGKALASQHGNRLCARKCFNKCFFFPSTNVFHCVEGLFPRSNDSILLSPLNGRHPGLAL